MSDAQTDRRAEILNRLAIRLVHRQEADLERRQLLIDFDDAMLTAGEFGPVLDGDVIHLRT